MTYPEIGDFFNRYVKNAEPLPIAEYYGKVGIAYQPSVASSETTVSAGLQMAFNGEAFFLGNVEQHAAECGFKQGDVMVGYEGQEVSMETIHGIAGELQALGENVPFELTVLRDGAELPITCEKVATAVIERYVFTIEESPTTDQAALRDAWVRNLPVANP